MEGFAINDEMYRVGIVLPGVAFVECFAVEAVFESPSALTDKSLALVT
jgi:hypothetical protein